MISPSIIDCLSRCNVVMAETRRGQWEGRCPRCGDGRLKIKGDPLKNPDALTCSGGCSADDVIFVVDSFVSRLSANAKPAPKISVMPPEPPGVNLLTLSDVKAEVIQWIWRGRIPLGALTLIIGDPGGGKSTLSLEVAARVSRGEGLPDSERFDEPADVILLSPEDSPSATIRPRLEAAGADLDRIHLFQPCEALPGGFQYNRPPVLPDDLPALRAYILRTGARLVIADPLDSLLSPELNSYRAQDVRQALAPAAMIAEETGAAIVIIHHPNKSAGANALYRSGGSIGIVGVVRSALLVDKDPGDESKRVIAPVKNNLSKFPPSLSFCLEDCGDVAKVVWEGVSTHTANALLAASSQTDAPGEASALTEAMDFLRDILADGPVKALSVTNGAEGAGVAKRTLDRAKAKLGVRSRKDSAGGGWVWCLPDVQEAAEPDPFGDYAGEEAA